MIRKAHPLVSVALGILLVSSVAGCDKAAAGGGGGIPSDKQSYIGNWAGQGSTMNITSNGQLTSHISDPHGAKADVSGNIQSITGSSIVVNSAGTNVTIPIHKEPAQANGKWTLVVGGIEGGEVTLSKN